MKYILHPDIALRSWQMVPYAYYVKGQRDARGLTKKEFQLLQKCDGKQEIKEIEILDLCRRGLCRPAAEGEALMPWQKHRTCDNRYFPAINWMITGKCNYNCLHCFNAADNARSQNEFTLEQAEKLIEEAAFCGINAFTITGGEPMMHPHFMEIIKSIYQHGMYVNELNTNGWFLTAEILEEMKKIGCKPLMKISFDGIGYHDWMRNREGAEEDAVRAIRLCAAHGFTVKAQTNVHRLNVHTMIPTAKFLSELGCAEMRIIRTTEAPRWEQNAGDACLTFTEYFDLMTEFAKEYARLGCQMDIDIWQFLSIFPSSLTYRLRPVECGTGEYRDSLPVCRGNRGMAAIGANGNLYPCHQLSGYYEHYGDYLGNVIEDGLQKHLQSGKYLEEVCTTVKTLRDENSECDNCKWFKHCCGGCRAVAMAFTHDKLGCDWSKCTFFKGGYPSKITKALPGYKNLKPIEE